MSNSPIYDINKDAIFDEMKAHSHAILPPTDVIEALTWIEQQNIDVKVTMIDPWYNKGHGGVRDDYVPYICEILVLASKVSPHVFLWGFPEIVALFIERLPPLLKLDCWLTWYYKNNPSVRRGWRSSQMTCLHLTREDAVLYPEHFLNEAQLQKKAEGKLRYMPGPTSVIESSLLVGFVGRKEQTGHKSQKPEAVYEPLYKMTTKPGDIVFDPMCGSGTSGAVGNKLGFHAILNDSNPEYVEMTERRLKISRIQRKEAPHATAAG